MDRFGMGFFRGWVGFWVGVSQLALASPPLWEGLPEVLPMNYLEQERFIPFREELSPENDETASRAPLGAEFFFNGVPVPGGNLREIGRVFQESVYAKIEPGTQIRVVKDSPGRPVWEYPSGTATAHLIQLKSKSRPVFELRLVKKLPEGRWAFGAYSPSTDSRSGDSVLRLHQYPGLKPERFEVVLEEGDRIQVAMKRIKLSSCRGCHLTSSPARYQYQVVDSCDVLDREASLRKTGPCGFVPGNPGVQAWVDRFLIEHRGAQPFNFED